MSERPIGTVLQFGVDAPDLPNLLRRVAASVEELGSDAQVVDIVIRADRLTADVYFLRR
jgi:hypothetical protein